MQHHLCKEKKDELVKSKVSRYLLLGNLICPFVQTQSPVSRGTTLGPIVDEVGMIGSGKNKYTLRLILSRQGPRSFLQSFNTDS